MKRSNLLFGASAPAPRPSYTPKEIRRYVVDYRRSGQTMAAFARQEGLKYHLLWRWLQRQNPRPAGEAVSRQLQPIPLSSVLGTAWAAEVVAANGMIVRLSAQAPASLALELVALSKRS